MNGYVNTLKEVTINHEVPPIHRTGNLVNQEVKTKSIVMPLKFQMKSFFERNNLLQPTLDYMKSFQNNDKLTNFVQEELWKEKNQLYPNKIVLPYFLYIDDFEINNPLGSHSTKHSICNIYYSFLALSIEEIETENDKNVIFSVHFILGLVIGDNLGLNSFLNFNKSFSSHFFCRFCRASKEDTHKLSSEKNELIRTTANYEIDALNANFGVAKNSQLNSIPSFHVVNNYYADVMHNLFEGICHYIFCHIIDYFISMKYFDLDTLNDRKQNFEYGPTEIDNISFKIEPHHLKKWKLKMSAREMMTFTLYFPIMIGDLVPLDDPVWNFLLNVIEIVDMLLCFEFDILNISILEKKIEKHNNDYITLFNDTLKPKYHNLTHYPKLIRKSGPLRKFWCFKYEAKHRQFKIYSRIITSRKNICLTLTKKYELKFAHQLIIGTNFLKLHFNPNIKHKTLSNYKNIISKILHNTEISIEFYSQVQHNGIEYKKDNYLVVYNNDVLFYKMLEIVVVEEKTLLFFWFTFTDCTRSNSPTSYLFNKDCKRKTLTAPKGILQDDLASSTYYLHKNRVILNQNVNFTNYIMQII
ncbi:hypothetical protein RN001_016152 [Aquatica leii]|uniref:Uncharacterized protein n=1 Tax=Aquatica leii TaxID=1421715 RepID=A0AAN7QB50_9COLE|nr:hypothetical protein RN001_016152 [Aquatica leii]